MKLKPYKEGSIKVKGGDPVPGVDYQVRPTTGKKKKKKTVSPDHKPRAVEPDDWFEGFESFEKGYN